MREFGFRFKSKYGANAYLAAAMVSLSLVSANPALALTDPQAGDLVALPPNINIFLYYNALGNAGTVTTTNGTNLDHTRLQTDINIFRYVHTVSIGGSVGGAEMLLPYVGYLGEQKVGGAQVAHRSGFGQPNFGLFFWPVNLPKTGTYYLLSGWLSPPISSFTKINNLTAPTLSSANNTLTETIETGARTLLLGTPTTKNLAIEGFYDLSFFQSNPNYASVYQPTPAGRRVGPFDATFRQQPTQELRAYLTYTFDPMIAASTSLGFYQSFGGKQTLKIAHVPQIVDTGNRTNESQLRFYLTSFVTETVQARLFVYYDVAAYGGPKQRVIGLRFAKAF
jgi:hypothetical protein